MKKITVGTEDFKRFIDEGFYFIDKSQFIEVALKDQVSLFTRPRRFGKTLNMSMLYYFLSNKEKENSYLFDGLKITNNKEIMALQNQYPVIFLTLKEMKNRTFEDQLLDLSRIVSDQIFKYLDILTDNHVHLTLKKRLQALYDRLAIESDLKNSLLYLSQGLALMYGQQVVILIDEYDVPLQAAYQYGYYEKMTDFLSAFFGAALKTNEALYKGIMTGCLRIAKESIFTGLNNFRVYSIFDNLSESCFGFTQDDVDEILTYYQLNHYQAKIKEWYDGYLFGGKEIYNPWSTLYYVSEVIDYPKSEPISYWANTSSNNLIFNYIKLGDSEMKEEFQLLVQNKSIVKTIKPELTYREMDDINNIYSFLLFTGYLKIKQNLGNNTYELVIPNKEVHQIYEEHFNTFFEEYKKERKNDLIDFLRAGKTNEAQKLLNNILMQSISFYDNYENFYHGLLIGLFRGTNTKSNRESGDGRLDIVIYGDDFDLPTVLIECKHSKHLSNLKADSAKACQQILENNYEKEIYGIGYEIIQSYGIAFYKKRCYITKLDSNHQ